MLRVHFLYIARESLSGAQYFIHLARRFGYLSAVDLLAERTTRRSACLDGLIRSVEKEAGKIATIAASVTSLLVLSVDLPAFLALRHLWSCSR